MHRYSERQQILRDLLMILIFLLHQETNDLIDSTMNIPTVPSLGRVVAPSDPGQALVIDILFEDESIVTDLLHLVLTNQYLNTRLPSRVRDEFDLAQLFDMREEDFQQAVQTTKSGFTWVLNLITLNPIFHSGSFCPQLPIAQMQREKEGIYAANH
jgi:hypothetical protein